MTCVNKRSARFLVTASVLAVLMLLAYRTEAEARDRSPLGQLRTSIQELFSPPRRARRAKPKLAETRERTTKPAATDQQRTAARDGSEQRESRHGDSRRTQESELPASREAVPQPRPRPAEAPPRALRTAKSVPVESPPQPRPRPPEARDRTAAIPPAAKEAPAPAAREAPAPPGKDAPADDESTPDATPPASPPGPSACQLRLTPDLAAIHILAPVSSGQCTVEDVVRLEAVIGKDGRRIAMAPPATLRCSMAESVIHWIRDEVAPVAADLGGAPKSMTVDTSFECRSRNQIKGAKLSEHGHANAIDVRGFTMTTGATVTFTDTAVDRHARERLREGACTRFTTVLGPGSDSYHETHIHLDLAERRSGYRMCQWDVRDPNVVASVPFPPERPSSAPPRSETR